MAVTPEDRAQIWEVVAERRALEGDYAGSLRALQAAEENRSLMGWKPGRTGR